MTLKSQKETKKMIYLQDRDVIDGLANDEAHVMQQSASSIYEKHLVKSMLPQNKNALWCARSVYLDSLEKAFEGVFSNLAAGIDWKAKESNARPLVDHFHNCILYCAGPTGEEKEWEYITSQLDSIADKLAAAAEDDPDISGELKKDSAYVREIIGEIEKSPTYIRYSTITGVILSNWEWLGNYTRTFRLLSAIASIAKGVQSDAEKRFEFVQILKEVSQEWKH